MTKTIFTRLAVLITAFFILPAFTISAQTFSDDNEIIQVETSLLKMSFVIPNYPAQLLVYEDGRRLDTFRIVKPEDGPNKWILVLDVDPGEIKKSLYQFKRLKKAAKQINAPEIVVVNTDFVKLEDVHKTFRLPREWILIGAEGPDQLWNVATQELAKTKSERKSVLGLTTRFNEITDEVMSSIPEKLTNPDLFFYFGTLNLRSGRKNVGRANILMNHGFIGYGKAKILDLHMDCFTSQVPDLHVVSFESELTGLREIRLSGIFRDKEIPLQRKQITGK